MRETAPQQQKMENRQEHWKKDFRVTVFCGASSPQSPQDQASASVENGYELGKILAEEGLDVANGGYALGAMDATIKGYKEEGKKLGFSDNEIKEHVFGEILSNEAVGDEFSSVRPVIEGTTITHDAYSKRIGKLIDSSQIHVALEGGIGTAVESLLASVSEWAHQQNTGKNAPVKPLIVIDSRQMLAGLLKGMEIKFPGSTKALNEYTYILSGYSNPNLKNPGHENELDVATLANDPKMREKVRLLLQLFQKQSDPKVYEKEIQKIREMLFAPKSPLKVLTLREWMEPSVWEI